MRIASGAFVAMNYEVGFQHEGTMRECVFKAGRYYDLPSMGILRSEYEISG
jgi:RimJ/RimL family protein N-acetyltransferase